MMMMMMMTTSNPLRARATTSAGNLGTALKHHLLTCNLSPLRLISLKPIFPTGIPTTIEVSS